jgi:hypothetical protein
MVVGKQEVGRITPRKSASRRPSSRHPYSPLTGPPREAWKASKINAWLPLRTSLVHNGALRVGNRTVRQSVTLPANVAAQVRSLAKSRRLSANRMLLELIENGMEAEKRKQQEFFDLAERFRSATDPEDVKRLGDQMGRMVFGN